jgi:imidazolonepropionase-like amidohydrolase
MAGSPANLVVRGKVEAGEIAGPRFYAAAPGLHEKNTTTPDQARDAVRKAKASGFDLIKSHHLEDVAVWQAVQDEARKQGLPTAGHVANPVGLERAMAANQQVEHLDGVLFDLLPAAAPERSIGFAQIPPPPVIRAVARVSDAQLQALARKAAAARSWHVPTLSLFEKIVDRDIATARLIADPAMRYVPAGALKQWSEQREQMLQSDMTSADGRAFRDVRRRVVAAFHRAGVPLMAGSDTAQAFHIWGPGLHSEIAALAAAGLPRMAALKAATVVPRDYFRSLPNGGSALGWKADFGTVTPGARADLILLPADPSRNLAALRRPNMVIAGGRLFDRAALDGLLTKAAADAKQ